MREITIQFIEKNQYLSLVKSGAKKPEYIYALDVYGYVSVYFFESFAANIDLTKILAIADCSVYTEFKDYFLKEEKINKAVIKYEESLDNGTPISAIINFRKGYEQALKDNNL